MSLFTITARFMFHKDRLRPNYKMLFLMLLISFVSVSCGKKGPLYISTKDAQIITKQADESVKPESKKETEKDAVKAVGDTPAESTK